MATRDDFELAFQLVLGHEGEFTSDPRDSGNWTGGKVNVGELRGTKWGISAAAYPNIKDIKNLSQGQAHDIYLADYWNPTGPDLPPRLAFAVFDGSVNNGPARSIRWLQAAVGTTIDGRYGPQTRQRAQAAAAKDEPAIIIEYQAHRLRFMVGLQTWNTFRGGWSRRIVKVPFECAAYWPRSESVNA